MLDKTHYPPPVATSTCTVSGQTIAKSDCGPRRRADLAARWRLGLIEIEPTIKLAATVFGVSLPLVNEAIGNIEASGTELNGTAAIPPIDPIWASMSNEERDAFVDRHMPTIWDAIERVTA
jgi:hypothetical protein